MNKDDIFTMASAQDVPVDPETLADIERSDVTVQEGKKKKKGFWANMWNKRRRGEPPLRKGQKGFPKKLPESQLKELIQLLIREELIK